MPKYYYDRDQTKRVLLEIRFRDKRGENKGRTESFLFDVEEWEAMTDEQHDAWQKKFDCTITYIGNMPIHSLEYIANLINKG